MTACIVSGGFIVWTIDPEGAKRYFIRHNKPFNGHRDEWSMVLGSVEPKEDLPSAAIREVLEESGIIIEQIALTDLNYSLSHTVADGPTIIHFFGAKHNLLTRPCHSMRKVLATTGQLSTTSHSAFPILNRLKLLNSSFNTYSTH